MPAQVNPIEPGPELHRVLIELSRDCWACVDEARGDCSRAEFIEHILRRSPAIVVAARQRGITFSDRPGRGRPRKSPADRQRAKKRARQRRLERELASMKGRTDASSRQRRKTIKDEIASIRKELQTD